MNQLRPTPERQAKGRYKMRETIEAGVKYAQDEASDSLADLYSRGVIKQHQWDAFEAFEELARRILGDVGQRSCLDFEPVGYDGGEGDPLAEGSWKVIRQKLGPSLVDVAMDAAYFRRNIVVVPPVWEAGDILAEYFQIGR